jgi:hypothetical protein
MYHYMMCGLTYLNFKLYDWMMHCLHLVLVIIHYQQRNNQTPSPTAYLPYTQGLTHKIAKTINKKDIKTSFKPLDTIKQKMRSVKYKLDQLNCKGVYRIECSYGKCYIRETNYSFHTRIKEHGADIKNE